MSNHTIKFIKNLISGCGIIQLADKQAEKQTDTGENITSTSLAELTTVTKALWITEEILIMNTDKPPVRSRRTGH